MNYELLGAQIRKNRKQKNYTLEQLAEKLDVSTTFIGQIERSKGVPSLETFVKIANVLEVSTDSLLFGDLNEKAGNDYFINNILELTKPLTSKQKDILLNVIEAFTKLKNSK